MIKVVVGSKNPVKVMAVREVFEKVFGEVEVVGEEVKSGVADQPISDEESIRGAENRAQGAVAKDGALYGVGLEGGVYYQGDKMFECAWCVVERRDGVRGWGGGLRFELPKKVAEGIERGKELGDVFDELLSRKNVKQQEGAVGVLTGGHVNRTKAYQQIVYLALSKFISEEWYT